MDDLAHPQFASRLHHVQSPLHVGIHIGVGRMVGIRDCDQCRQVKHGITPFHRSAYAVGVSNITCEDLKLISNIIGASILAAAYRAGVPIYTSSPGDSGLGMHVAENSLRDFGTHIIPSIDVNETAAIVYAAKRARGKSAVVLIGGGSPKNFLLQTEPYMQEILHIEDVGHDYFLQFTDARPDTGGLSGATPHEAVSWGKVDPNKLPDAIVCYMDVTVALPLLTHYALAKHNKRKYRNIYDQRDDLVEALEDRYWKENEYRMEPGKR